MGDLPQEKAELGHVSRPKERFRTLFFMRI